MIKRTFDLYEQLVADTTEHFQVEFTYEAKTPGKESDSHGLRLSLLRPGAVFSFAEIAIEYRNGVPRIMVWAEPDLDGSDPVIFEPNMEEN